MILQRACAAVRQGACEMKIYLGNNLPPCVLINLCAGDNKQAASTQLSTFPVIHLFLLLMITSLARELLSTCNKGNITGNSHTVTSCSTMSSSFLVIKTLNNHNLGARSSAPRSTTQHHAAPRSTTQHHAAPRSTTQHYAAHAAAAHAALRSTSYSIIQIFPSSLLS